MWFSISRLRFLSEIICNEEEVNHEQWLLSHIAKFNQDLCRGQIDLSSVSPSIVSLMIPVATTVWIGSSTFPLVFSTLLWRRYWSLFWRRSSFSGSPWCCWWCFRFRYAAQLWCRFRCRLWFASCRCGTFTIGRNRGVGDCDQVGFWHVDAPPRPLVIPLLMLL